MTSGETCAALVTVLNSARGADRWSGTCWKSPSEAIPPSDRFCAEIRLSHVAPADKYEEIYAFGQGGNKEHAWRECLRDWLDRSAGDLRVPPCVRSASTEELRLKLAAVGRGER